MRLHIPFTFLHSHVEDIAHIPVVGRLLLRDQGLIDALGETPTQVQQWLGQYTAPAIGLSLAQEYTRVHTYTSRGGG